MIEKIEQLIKDTRENFEKYLSDKHREELLPRVNELFDYKVNPINDEISVSLEYEGDKIYDEKIKINALGGLSNRVQDSIEAFYDDNMVIKFNIGYNDEEVFSKDVVIDSVTDIQNALQQYKGEIYEKIGYIEICLVHNNTEELVCFNMKLNDLPTIVDKIKEYEDIIYSKYVIPEQKDRQMYYGESHETTSVSVGQLIFGDFIVDEFDNYIGDENGNCLIWQ